MAKLGDIYRPSLALLTDLYQLTMTYAHWKAGTHGKRAVFNLFFRLHPFKGGFRLACGLHRALDLLETYETKWGRSVVPAFKECVF